MKNTLVTLAALIAASAGALAQDAIKITEVQYKGMFGEFFEVTNRDSIAINMANFVFDDNSANPLIGLNLGGLGTLQPGQSGIVTEVSEEIFELAWFIEPNQNAATFPQGVFPPVLEGNTINLGRTDSVVLFVVDATQSNGYREIDRIDYTDEGGANSGFRSEDDSAVPTSAAIGANDFPVWKLSSTVSGSWKSGQPSKNGTSGSPGKLVVAP